MAGVGKASCEVGTRPIGVALIKVANCQKSLSVALRPSWGSPQSAPHRKPSPGVEKASSICPRRTILIHGTLCSWRSPRPDLGSTILSTGAFNRLMRSLFANRSRTPHSISGAARIPVTAHRRCNRQWRCFRRCHRERARSFLAFQLGGAAAAIRSLLKSSRRQHLDQPKAQSAAGVSARRPPLKIAFGGTNHHHGPCEPSLRSFRTGLRRGGAKIPEIRKHPPETGPKTA